MKTLLHKFHNTVKQTLNKLEYENQIQIFPYFGHYCPVICLLQQDRDS